MFALGTCSNSAANCPYSHADADIAWIKSKIKAAAAVAEKEKSEAQASAPSPKAKAKRVQSSVALLTAASGVQEANTQDVSSTRASPDYSFKTPAATAAKNGKSSFDPFFRFVRKSAKAFTGAVLAVNNTIMPSRTSLPIPNSTPANSLPGGVTNEFSRCEPSIISSNVNEATLALPAPAVRIPDSPII